MSKKNWIEGIHSYCDRWCERCPFTQRCEVFAAESSLTESEKDPENEVFWENLTDNFAEAIKNLREIAAEHGIDLDLPELSPVQRAKTTPSPRPHQPLELEPMARRYALLAEHFFVKNERFFVQRERELVKKVKLELPIDERKLLELKDALEVIQWYRLFVAAKIHRAMTGLKWLNELTDDLDPIQNDANGSAKIAKIAIERSLTSWEFLRNFFPEKTDELLDLLVILTRMHRKLSETFPDVEKFSRPGFDQQKV